jgi:uncharacterized protein HemX
VSPDSWSAGPTKPAPSSSAKSHVRRNVLIAAALAATIAVGGFMFQQQSSLTKSRAQATSLQTQLTASQGKVSSLKSDVTTLQARATDLGGQISDLNSQVAACAREMGYSLRMDTALNSKVENALFNGSYIEWANLTREYNSAGDLWVTAANQCDPGGDYTFD